MLKRDWFKGKRVTVFGIGLNRGALTTIQFLVEAGVREVIATDIKTKNDLAPTLTTLAKYRNITYVLGQHRPEDFTQTDMVVKNPSIPWTNEYVKLALTHHIPVEMDASLFIQLVKRPMIGVTGTKGKTTTAALIAHLLERSDRPIVRAGINQIGFLGTLATVTDQTTIVAELSSWRLSSFAMHQYSPAIAVITNIYPDHLNYYKKMATYIADKEVIFRFQSKDGVLILNRDNEATRLLAEKAPGQIMWFSEHELTDAAGVFLRDSVVYERTAVGEQLLFPWPAVKLPGEHNHSNILAAIAAVRVVGLNTKEILTGLESFRGVPHRLEYVGEHGTVRYYNDTAATMPEAAMAGIRSFDAPVVLIAGGADKGFDYAALAYVFATEPKAVVLFRGAATEKLLPLMIKAAKSRGQQNVDYPVVESMEEAIQFATSIAGPGDVVLLSPGTSSFGLFQNEFDRGEQFRAGVQRLTNVQAA